MTRALGVAVFVGIALVGLGLDLRGRRGTSSAPNLTQVIDWLQARAVGRIAVFAIWGFSGRHFFVR